ncbi:MAG TPA: hypothetical protein VIV12_26640 [Streptosporangiaceae bacterium]
MTVTPTKPLTVTHAKALLWLDVIHRSSRELTETTYLWNPRLSNLTAQTAAFWHYLDRVAAGMEWSRCSERELGELYVRSHTEADRPAYDAIRPYLERVETEGWIHPASRRLLQLWTEQLRLLNAGDHGLTANRPLELSADTVLGLLDDRDLLIDHRRFGGPVYLDGTVWGLPLRQLIGADGHLNYLLQVLRQLIPLTGADVRLLLVFDQELTQDYVLLDRVLATLGARVARLALGRVPLGGMVKSSRHGGWEGRTLADLSRACLEDVDLPTYRLGMRIYFVTVLERTSHQSFRPELLRRSLLRARRILDALPQHAERETEYLDFLRRMWNSRGYVDPYRLTNSLLCRHGTAPVGRLVPSVYL